MGPLMNGWKENCTMFSSPHSLTPNMNPHLFPPPQSLITVVCVCGCGGNIVHMGDGEAGKGAEASACLQKEVW